MDGLRHKARDVFGKHQVFTGSQIEVQKFEIHKYSDGDIQRHSTSFPAKETKRAFMPTHPANRTQDDTIASLTVLLIQCTKNFALETSKEDFYALFEEAELDSYIFYPTQRGVDNFYAFGNSPSMSSISSKLPQSAPVPTAQDCGSEDAYPRKPDTGVMSESSGPMRSPSSDTKYGYLVSVKGFYMLAWSFCPQTRTTRALLVSPPLFFVFSALKAELNRQKYLIRHPLLLAFVSGIYLVGIAEANVGTQEKLIAEVEHQTGYHPWEAAERSARGFHEESEDVPSVLSWKMSATCVMLALHTRRLVLGKTLIGKLRSESRIGPSTLPEIKNENRSILEAVGMLEPTIDTNLIYIEFLRERSRTQLTVLFNLIAQRDATVNISLAKDSRTIALASQHDSSSMKTIAIMTMVFLPATFFATFFSTPLLQWDTSPVVQKKFWVFWAFTLPVTALIFAIWIAVMKRQEVAKIAENKRQRKNVRIRTRRFRPEGAKSVDSSEHEVEDEVEEGAMQTLKRKQSWVQKVLRYRRRVLNVNSDPEVELTAVKNPDSGIALTRKDS